MQDEQNKSLSLTALLGARVPLIQAGMGGIATPPLAAAVSEAGAAGVLGLYNLPPEWVTRQIAETRCLTSQAFGVNFVPQVVTSAQLRAQLEAVLASRCPGLFVTTYGLAPPEFVDKASDAGIPVLMMVGSPEEAERAVVLGADAVILQGQESGGHLLGERPIAILLEETVALGLGVPLVAAGGIGCPEDATLLLARGAAGCLCGTLFVATIESNAHPAYKQHLIEATAADTVITERFELGWPDRPHRVLRCPATEDQSVNRSMAFVAATVVAGRKVLIPRFSAAVPTSATVGRVEEMAMYCGTGVSAVSAIRPAAALVDEFMTGMGVTAVR